MSSLHVGPLRLDQATAPKRSTFRARLSPIAIAACLTTLVVHGACVERSDIDGIKRSQEQVLAKLDKMEKERAQPLPAPNQPPPRPMGPDAAKTYAYPVGKSAALGARDAWVTIIEISDFQCPFCSRVNGTIDEIKKTYKNDVRIVFKHNPLPFHNRALPAAQATECAHEQNKFWEMHDKIFANQKDLDDSALEGFAKSLGLKMSQYKTCLADGKITQDIKADQATAAKFGAMGTPAFFVNGRFISGAQPFAAFKSVIDEELNKAKSSGVAKKDFYAKVIETSGEKSL